MMLSVPASCSVAPAASMAVSAVLRGIGTIAVMLGLPAPVDHSGFALCQGRDSLLLVCGMDRAVTTKGTDQEHTEHHANTSRHCSLVVDDDLFASKNREKVYFRMPAATNMADVLMHDLHACSGDAAKGLLVSFNPICAVYGASPFSKTSADQNYRTTAMNNIFGGPEQPPSVSEIRNFETELWNCHSEFLRAYCLKNDQRLDPDKFSSDVLNAVQGRYWDTDSFRAEISKKGIRELRNIAYFWGIVRNIYREHQRKHYNAMPRETTLSETIWLRLLLCRDDGMVFPLVRNGMSLDERRWLEKLEAKKMNKVRRVTAPRGTAVWALDEAKRPMTLVLTPRREGGGERDLEKLFARRYLETAPVADPAQIWTSIEGVPCALRLSGLGRSYIKQLGTAATLTSIHARGKGEEKVLANGIDHPQEVLDDYYSSSWYVGLDLNLNDVLAVAVERLGMPQIHARVYLLRKVGDPPEEGPWPRWRVAAEVGLHHRKVERIENAWDEDFRNPEVNELMKMVLSRD